MTNEDMKLPDNKTCGDCAHLFRCIKLFGAQLTNIECDFFPIKFVSNIMTTAQEPVGWMDSEGRFRLDFKTEIVRSIAAVNKEIPLYTHPAQPLSNDDIHNIADHSFAFASEHFDEIFRFARAIEQAHGIGS